VDCRSPVVTVWSVSTTIYKALELTAWRLVGKWSHKTFVLMVSMLKKSFSWRIINTDSHTCRNHIIAFLWTESHVDPCWWWPIHALSFDDHIVIMFKFNNIVGASSVCNVNFDQPKSFVTIKWLNFLICVCHKVVFLRVESECLHSPNFVMVVINVVLGPNDWILGQINSCNDCSFSFGRHVIGKQIRQVLYVASRV